MPLFTAADLLLPNPQAPILSLSEHSLELLKMFTDACNDELPNIDIFTLKFDSKFAFVPMTWVYALPKIVFF